MLNLGEWFILFGKDFFVSFNREKILLNLKYFFSLGNKK